MSARKDKLLRRFSVAARKPVSEVKREWNSTPRNRRGEVRSEMVSGMWSNELKEWRFRNNRILQKEASDFLRIPEDTYRNWECGRRTPHRFVQIFIRQRMREFESEKQKLLEAT